MKTIANLNELQQYIGLPAGEDDSGLLQALQAATAEIERWAARRFLPVYETRTVDVDLWQPGQLLLDADLLEITTVIDGSGTVIPVEDLTPLPLAGPSIAALERDDGGVFYGPTVQVTGWWAWHDDRAVAWRNTLDTVENDPMSTLATTLFVTNADAADAAGEEPRFQDNMLLRVGDEMMRAVSVSLLADQITVARGVGGTSAAATHIQGTAVYAYHPPADVVRLCLRWAAALYREPDQPHADLLDYRSLALGMRLRRIRV